MKATLYIVRGRSRFIPLRNALVAVHTMGLEVVRWDVPGGVTECQE